MNKAGKLAGEWGPLVLLTLGTLWVVQGALALTPGHGVIVQGLDYNAGNVTPGTMIRHSLKVTNLSAQTININAEASCGCTLLDTLAPSLSPMRSEVVEAKIDTYAMPIGIQRKSVIFTLAAGGRVWKNISVIRFQIKQATGGKL